MKHIDADKLIAEIEKEKKNLSNQDFGERCAIIAYNVVLSFIATLQQETPDKDTIIRICKLHKVWSITAPWENIEDFVTTNWNSNNIV